MIINTSGLWMLPRACLLLNRLELFVSLPLPLPLPPPPPPPPPLSLASLARALWEDLSRHEESFHKARGDWGRHRPGLLDIDKRRMGQWPRENKPRRKSRLYFPKIRTDRKLRIITVCSWRVCFQFRKPTIPKNMNFCWRFDLGPLLLNHVRSLFGFVKLAIENSNAQKWPKLALYVDSSLAERTFVGVHILQSQFPRAPRS